MLKRRPHTREGKREMITMQQLWLFGWFPAPGSLVILSWLRAANTNVRVCLLSAPWPMAHAGGRRFVFAYGLRAHNLIAVASRSAAALGGRGRGGQSWCCAGTCIARSTVVCRSNLWHHQNKQDVCHEISQSIPAVDADDANGAGGRRERHGEG